MQYNSKGGGETTTHSTNNESLPTGHFSLSPLLIGLPSDGRYCTSMRTWTISSSKCTYQMDGE